MTTDRLDLISGRSSDMAQYEAMCAEPEIQHWLGWAERSAPIEPAARDARALPMWHPQPIRPANLEHTEFVAVHRATNMIIGGVGLRADDGSHHVGGAFRGGFRNQGYGLETMVAVLDVFHRHFGLVELRAGCEVGNLASRRWLTAAGFTPADGPAKFTLPDGRVIDSMWWSHRDPDAKRRCDRLYDTIDLADAAAQARDVPPEAPAPAEAEPLR